LFIAQDETREKILSVSQCTRNTLQ